MRTLARTIYPYLVALVLAGVVVQFFLAGLAVFDIQADADAGTTVGPASFEQAFDAHLAVGNIVALSPLLLVAVALVAGVERRAQLAAVGFLALIWIQAALAFIGSSGVRALHPVVGLLALGVGAYIMRDAYGARRAR